METTMAYRARAFVAQGDSGAQPSVQADGAASRQFPRSARPAAERGRWALNMRTLTVLVCCVLSSPISAGILPPQQREELIQAAFANFWGKARLSNGAYVEAETEFERLKLPILKSTANHVISVGELSGIAEWCGLNWQAHFLSLTTAARRQGFTEKQIAFIGLLHGVAQGNVHSAMDNKDCTAEQKAKGAKMLDLSPVKQAIPQ